MEALLQYDIAICKAVNAVSLPILDGLMYLVSLLGEWGALLWIICLVVLFTDREKGKTAAFLCILTVIVSDQVVGKLLKHLWNRPRPYMYLEGIKSLGHQWTNSSFPSGHANAIVAGTVILSYFYPSLRWPLVIFSLLTCISRIYCGMHHPLDVAAGALTGLAVGFLFLYLYRMKGKRALAEPS
ncbi:MAG: phosphatase PAP2 family protein [Candidatus Eremiobacteraeota bacterium]|nr:phosphatase PAP2 family protein [Candidatus Eremiobacteraeota bacterium]